MAFTQFNFNPNISKALQMCGYDKPTPIQLRSIPDILKGEDIVASSETGSGKTAAFILPTLQRLSSAKSTIKPRVLVLTPTRELAAQIIDAAQKYGKFLRFNMVTLVGGASYRQQLKGLSRPCDIIVATPGRLLDHMENKKIDLSGIEMLILDEADRMLDMGFIDDVKTISKATPYTRQTLLFSATVDDKLSQIIRQLLKNPVRIDLTTEKLAPVSIKQQLYIADNIQHKNKLLHHFLTKTSIYKAIIFSATKVNADKMAKELRAEGLLIAPLHGDLKQAIRNRTIEQFRRGKIQYLIATDVASRGIDVPDVTHVINYDLPKFSEDYAHRIGRTGRAGKEGIAISFALPIDARHLQKIECYMGQRLEIATIPGLEATKSMSSQGSQSRKDGGRKKRSRGAKSRFSDEKRKFRDNDFASRRRSGEGKKYSEKTFDAHRRSATSEGKKFGGKVFVGEERFPNKEKRYADKVFHKEERSPNKRERFGDKVFRTEEGSPNKRKKFGDKVFRTEERSPNKGKKFGDKVFRTEEGSPNKGKKFGDKVFRTEEGSPNKGKKFGDKVFRTEEGSPNKGKKFGDKVFRTEERSPNKRKSFADKPFVGDRRSPNNSHKKSAKLDDKKENGFKEFGRKKRSNNTHTASNFSKKKKNKY